MGWSKRQLVEAAFEELGMAGYVFNLQPEQLQIAARRLDAMMAQWSALGIRVSYPISDNPKSVRIEDVTQVPDFALEAIFKNLALKLAPVYGKQISPDLRSDAKRAYNALLSKVVGVREMALGVIPAGAGRKTPLDPFIEERIDDVQTGLDGYIEYSGNEGIGDFS